MYEVRNLFWYLWLPFTFLHPFLLDYNLMSTQMPLFKQLFQCSLLNSAGKLSLVINKAQYNLPSTLPISFPSIQSSLCVPIKIEGTFNFFLGAQQIFCWKIPEKDLFPWYQRGRNSKWDICIFFAKSDRGIKPDFPTVFEISIPSWYREQDFPNGSSHYPQNPKNWKNLRSGHTNALSNPPSQIQVPLA